MSYRTSYHKDGEVAIIDWRNGGFAYDHFSGVRLSDDDVYAMVDDGIEEVRFLMFDGRYSSSLDDWLERSSSVASDRYMPFTMMDKV